MNIEISKNLNMSKASTMTPEVNPDETQLIMEAMQDAACNMIIIATSLHPAGLNCCVH